jgi:asparaginyl-tRNA synthetase
MAKLINSAYDKKFERNYLTVLDCKNIYDSHENDGIIEYKSNKKIDNIQVCGWIHIFRKQKNMIFINLNDGSTVECISLVLDEERTQDFEQLKLQVKKGSSLRATGDYIYNKARDAFEFVVKECKVYGTVDAAKYPISKNKMSLETIRENPHLRIRTLIISSIMRIRDTLAQATHQYFNSIGCKYVHTPILTTNDCEGAGETFTVTTQYPQTKDDKPIYFGSDKKELFGRGVNLTVSGQLHGETYAAGLGDIYTFGPTFRAENSNTNKHLCEFWMIEPELTFIDFKQLQDLSEDYVKYCISSVLEHNLSDLQFLQKRNERLIERLGNIIKNDFARVSYTDAIKIIQAAQAGGRQFEESVEWGSDLATEHERFLAEEHFKRPTFVTDYPTEIKSFYMKTNDEDGGKTVQATDLLVPGIGELIGGSMREENYDKLISRMTETQQKELSWYLDLRRYGTTPHGGFGLGFERLVQLVTGTHNIRDVIPYPRYPKHCTF